MIHGHCHGNLHHGEDTGFYNGRKVMDVGCNLINYTPISYKEVIQKFK
jgi:calcineurin-like phosphoesterase family protein